MNGIANPNIPLVAVKGLVYVYPNGTQALSDVSLEIYRGERVAIVGQNGSGKTTLVKHFNGLLKATRGTVLVNNMDARTKRTAQLAKTVGYVFQNPNHQLFCETVYKELCFGLLNLRMPPEEVDERAKQAIDLFHLEPYLKVHPYSLSMGVRKLVAIASIFAMSPDLIILDEPTTGQDYRSRMILAEAIATMHANGKTVMFVSHDMNFVSDHAGRAVVMCQGRVQFDGEPRELFNRPQVLEAAFLRPPQITELGQALTDYSIPPTIISVPEMLAEVRRHVK